MKILVIEVDNAVDLSALTAGAAVNIIAGTTTINGKVVTHTVPLPESEVVAHSHAVSVSPPITS